MLNLAHLNNYQLIVIILQFGTKRTVHLQLLSFLKCIHNANQLLFSQSATGFMVMLISQRASA